MALHKATLLLKNFASKFWFHQFFWELNWVIKENNFLLRLECHTFVNRLINKYKKENEEVFDYYFSREEIDSLMVNVGRNWKVCLLDFEISGFIF